MNASATMTDYPSDETKSNPTSSSPLGDTHPWPITSSWAQASASTSTTPASSTPRTITSRPNTSTNTKTHLRQLFGTYLANNTSVLVVVDQPNNIDRLTVAVAQVIGAEVRYLPGLAMRQLSRTHAGNSELNMTYLLAPRLRGGTIKLWMKRLIMHSRRAFTQRPVAKEVTAAPRDIEV